MNAVHDILHGIDLVRAHDEQFLLGGNQYHVSAEHLSKVALAEELLGKVVEVGYFFVVFGCELVNGQELLVGMKAEVLVWVIGEVIGIAAVADDKKLHEAQQGIGVAVAGVVFVVHDLLHGAARTDVQGFEFDLHHRNAVHQQYHIVAVMAIEGVDSQLVDDFKLVFAPVFDVDQGVLQRGAVFACDSIALPEYFRGGKHIGGDDFIAQAGEFCIGEVAAVQCLEFFTEIALQAVPVPNIRAIGIFEFGELSDQAVFNLFFCRHSIFIG